MLYIRKTDKPLWEMYVGDTICMGGRYYPIQPGLSETEIDDWVWEKLSEEARKTLDRKYSK
jgi:hypothetical protein